jgi:hypothetical protein
MSGEPALTFTTNAVFRCEGLEQLHDKSSRAECCICSVDLPNGQTCVGSNTTPLVRGGV